MLRETISGFFQPRDANADAHSLARAFANLQYPWTLENPNLDLTDYSTWEQILDGNGGGQALSGVRVTTKDLLCFGPVMRALKILGGGISMSPMYVKFAYPQEPGEDSIDERHPCNIVTSLEWNVNTTAAAGWKTFMQQCGLFGSAYAWIQRSHGGWMDPKSSDWGSVTGLFNLNPLTTHEHYAQEDSWLGDGDVGRLYCNAGDRYYTTMLDDREIFLANNEVLQYTMFRGMGLPVLAMLKNIIGLSMAAEGFQSKFFANGGQAGGFIQVPAGTTPKSAENLQRELHKRADAAAWFKVHILRDGAKFNKLTIDPQTAAMHAIDENSARRVYDFYNINPTVAGMPGSDSYGAGESARLAHVNDCLGDHMNELTQEARLKMMSPKQRRATGKNKRLFWFDTVALTNPDWMTQLKGLLLMRDSAVINANDVLSALGQKTRKDPQAVEYFNPSTASKDLDTTEGDDTSSTDKGKQKPDPKKKPEKKKEQADVQATEDQKHWQQRALSAGLKKAAARISAVAVNRAKQAGTFAKFVDTGFGECRGIFEEEVVPMAKGFQLNPAQIALAEKQFYEIYTSVFIEQLTSSTDNAVEPVRTRKLAAKLTPEQMPYDGIVHQMLKA